MLFEGYPDEWEVSDLYDRDADFVTELREAFPTYEYPDISWMTVGQLRVRILRWKIRDMKRHMDNFMDADKKDDAKLAAILGGMESTLEQLNAQVKGKPE